MSVSQSGIKISVGMPVYNGERYVETAIRSILNQTEPSFELIISDNASTDRTEEICSRLAEEDGRIRYTRNSRNIGAAGNYNRLFPLASGEYFRWANADDISGPELHEKCLAVLEDHADVVLAYGKTMLIDENGDETGGCEDNLDLRQARASERFIEFWNSVGLTNAIYGLMRSSALGRTPLMGDGSYPAADTNLMAALTLQGKFHEIPGVLFYRRMHPEASSWDRGDEKVQTEFWSAGSKKFTLGYWRKHFADLRAVSAAPVDPSEKLRLLTHVARRAYWDKRRLVWELAQVGRKRSGRDSA